MDGPLNILLVDDCCEDRECVRTMLCAASRDRSYHFTEASSGEEALGCVSRNLRNPYSCILLDYQLPDMTGTDFLRKLCAGSESPPCPVVVITGRADDNGPEMLRAGAQDYIEKSWWNSGSLARAIRNACERHVLQRDWAYTRRAAEQANRSKDLFLAMLSHELRTPLTPVLLTATERQRDPRVPLEVRAELLMIETNIGLQVRLIDDLLDLSRITHGKVLLRPEVFDLHPLVKAVVAMLKNEAAAKGIAITLSLHAAQPRVLADAVRIQQVISNLLRNAIKFTPRNGAVMIRTRDPDDTCAGHESAGVCLEVCDTGIGFSGEAKDLFEPFAQGASGHPFGGLGLGLAVARGIIESHHGTLTATSRGQGQGAVFAFTLPRCPNGADQQAGHATHVELDSKFAAPSLKILVVENHPASREAIEFLLSHAGHKITTAESVADACRAAQLGAFDLVVSDLGLPDGSGLELMKYLRDRHALIGIALTGHGSEEILRKATEVGFRMHLLKPVKAQELRRAVGKVWADRKSHI